ncbi:MAG: LytTR family DNA-binding domain-containing protein [Chitinophagaceae bacterium]
MKPLRCVIVDDEPLAREGLESYVLQIDFLERVTSLGNSVELNALLLEKTGIDLIFLDVQMPLMSGIDFLKIRNSRPMVILTTAYPQYALESYQLDVLDYLVKPITFDRFFKAVSKARDYHQLLHQGNNNQLPHPGQVGETISPAPGYFFIRSDYRYEKIFYNDILFIESLQNYASVQTVDKKFITLLTLKQLENKLPAELFIRAHKSFIVAKNKVSSLEPQEIRIGDYRIPVGRLFRDAVLRQIVDDKLWRKE